MKILSSIVVVLALVASSFEFAVAQGDPAYRDASQLDQQLLSLLKSKKFDDLDARLNRIVMLYEKDSQFEETLDVAVDVFYRAGPDLEGLLTEWIAKQPRSYMAHLARGVYYTRVGWSRRGARYVDKTSNKEFDAMEFNFKRAWKDLDQAYALNDRLVPALCYMMEILMNFSQQEQIRALREKALQIDPLSRKARWFYITTLLPRWGGSIPEISKEIDDARRYYAKKPTLKVLEGRIPAEYGDQAMFSGDYAKAVDMYSTALSHGGHWFYNKQRGETYMRAQRYDLAAKDLDAAIQLRPNYSAAQYMRGFGKYTTGRLSEAIIDLTSSVEANPYDHKAWNIRGDSFLRLGKADLALADFERAIALDPNNPEYLADRDKARKAKR